MSYYNKKCQCLIIKLEKINNTIIWTSYNLKTEEKVVKVDHSTSQKPLGSYVKSTEQKAKEIVALNNRAEDKLLEVGRED